MKFVKYHDRHALKRRVINQHTCKNTLCDNLNPCPVRHPCVKPHPISDCRTGWLIKHIGHPLRNLPCSQSPRLQHNDTPVIPKPIQDSQREQSGFSGPRRSSYDKPRMQNQLPVHLIGNPGSRQIRIIFFLYAHIFKTVLMRFIPQSLQLTWIKPKVPLFLVGKQHDTPMQITSYQ